MIDIDWEAEWFQLLDADYTTTRLTLPFQHFLHYYIKTSSPSVKSLKEEVLKEKSPMLISENLAL